MVDVVVFIVSNFEVGQKKPLGFKNPSFQPGFLSVGFEHDLEDCQGPDVGTTRNIYI